MIELWPNEYLPIILIGQPGCRYQKVRLFDRIAEVRLTIIKIAHRFIIDNDHKIIVRSV